MVKQNIDFSLASYILGIVSIVMAIFLPLSGVVFGIIGLILNKKAGKESSIKAKNFNILGIILGAVLFIISILITIFLPDLMAKAGL